MSATATASASVSGQTPSQTVGPFFHYGLIFPGENVLHREGAQGQRIIVTGQVFDGDGAPLPDVMLEIWQADAHGRYRHPADPRHADADPHFFGFGRSDTTHADQTFRFETVKPGTVPATEDVSPLAPHLAVHVFGRGLLTHLATRMYFADEAAANATDPVFASLSAAQQKSLLALPQNDADSDVRVYHWDLHLQGDSETLFFHP
ncbi:protocatechuate 3,4-dioxygenase subunit alpha [Actomonas aquatica]|uniref:Protocatechuate 3,4-dioxygenase subunit alpha n=1 Tax=Actomonas aquatica TaxID=2866162 RepID=A0ABZ1C8Z5_9BACT|nr:protocatechuate 3,4-dioxygenase subunit alpha [Opitutus sp. WL0086]WRQ87887.1 protocatechuate 3,4-dioxygenase subunit alpha [Opitutus sp. WL0086]